MKRALLVAILLALSASALPAGRPFAIPPIDKDTNNGGSFADTAVLLDAAGEQWAGVFRWWGPTCIVERLRFRTQTVITGAVVNVCLQDVDATTGNPDGSCDQFRAHTINNSDDNVGLVTGLITADGTDTGAKRTLNTGDSLAVVIELNSAGNMNISARNGGAPGNGFGSAYLTHKTGGAWSKLVVMPRFAVECQSETYYEIPGVDPYAATSTFAISSETFNSASAPDERGNNITMPYAATAVGIWVSMDPDNDADLVLYNGTTAERTVSLDPDVRRIATPDGYMVPFASGYPLTAGGTYRVVVKPGASNVTVYSGSVAVAAAMGAAPGGHAIFATSRTDAGSWDDTATTKRYLIGLVVTVDAQGGGVSAARVPNGM